MVRRRLRFYILYAAIATIALAIFFCWLAVPRILHSIILSKLDAAGLHGIALTVRRATPWNLEITDLHTTGPNPHRIASISIDHTPSSLWHGEIHNVRITGVELTLSFHNGQPAIDSLPTMTSAETPRGPSTLSLPFNRIDLDLSSIKIISDAQTITIPMHGSIVRQQPNLLHIDLHLAPSNKPLDITGDIGPTTSDINLTASAKELDASIIGAIAAAWRPEMRPTSTGTLAMDAHLKDSATGLSATFNLQPQDASFSMQRAGAKEPTNLRGIWGVYHVEATKSPDSPMQGTLALQNATFDSPSSGLWAKLVQGEIAFDDMIGLVTKPNQKLAIASLNTGKINFNDGSIVFNMNGPTSLSVSHTQWSWLGGTVSADDAKVNGLHMEGALQMDHVDLHQLLDLFASGEADGDGQINGQVPLTIDWPDIHFGKGQIGAAPGGKLTIKDVKSLSAILNSARMNDDDKRDVLEALGDFKYDLLQAALSYDSDGLLTDVHMAGKGATGAHKAINLELRLHGLGDVIQLYLGYRKGMASLTQGH